MRDAKRKSPGRKEPRIRCGIYTRKSTEEGLEQEFSSLDAQRESAEAYIRSQAQAGWTCLPERYDDGGYSGGNLDRPALRQLLTDIEAGKVDCVLVYKVDRLSRSLLDFARLMETFERHQVAFVCVTQQFNTATSMGRLVLNVLLSFAQFEREMIAERTRDKIAATRRKGKWSGGVPPLGYDVQQGKLVVNEAEAERVRAIFALYLEQPSLTLAVRELQRRGWTTKSRTTRKGLPSGGYAFDKNRLSRLLRNVIYVGQVRYQEELHRGEHQPIVEAATFQQVQQALETGSRRRGRNRNDPALLRGLLRCGACDCPMVFRTAAKGLRRYPYYVCQRAVKEGWSRCPTPSLSGGGVEQFVTEQMLRLLPESEDRCNSERLAAGWAALPLRERLVLVDRLIERVVYDGQQKRVSITFRNENVPALVEAIASQEMAS